MNEDIFLPFRFYPYFYLFRSGAALRLGNVALQQNTKAWYEAAQPEVLDALKYDPYAPDLLALMININLNLNNVKDAQIEFNLFKKVAKKSYLINYVKHENALKN